MNEIDTARRNRNRTFLVLIAVMFFGSMAVAGLLRFSGWQPEGMKNHGELLQPAADARDARPRGADGSEYPWQPETRTWRIVAVPPDTCDAGCGDVAGQLELVWALFNKDSDRVHVLWLGQWPEGAKRPGTLVEIVDDGGLRAQLPRNASDDGVPVYVVDPNGFVVLRYPPGFDPGGLRKDLVKLLKLR